MIAIAGRSSFVIARIVLAQPGIVIERARVVGTHGQQQPVWVRS
jgi:hypothetical protein